MTTELSAAAVHRRFLVLTAVRWFPVGLLLPVFVLLPLERGLTLAQFGLVASAQGFVVFALELPTGSLADTVGRRRVLLVASVVSIVSTAMYLVATSPALFMVAMVLQGIYRALDSGPLEPWYVDATLAADRDAGFERGLSGAGAVLGVAISLGAVTGGGLAALGPLGPLESLAVPVAASLGLQLVRLAAVAVVMVEPTRSRPAATTGHAAAAVRSAIGEGIGLLRRSGVLLALVCVELTWGFGVVAFESLFPVRLGEIVGDADRAAAILGPTAAVAWLAFSAGSAVVPAMSRRLGVAGTAALMRVLQGTTVVAMAWSNGLAGAVTAYLACYAVHGASNPSHMTLIHRQVEGPLRATVLSLNSMASQPAGAVGLIVLTALADATSVTTAMYLAAAVLALGSLLYLPGRRQERGSPPAAATVAP
ncbi:MAG: MFS transporter [Acidimicrobiia bacterium]